MKTSFCLSLLFAAAVSGAAPAAAQTSRDVADARVAYQQANTGAVAEGYRASLKQQTSGFVGGPAFQLGYLRTADGRSLLVPGLRYHAGLHLLEAQDSIDLESTHFWPASSLRGFDLGEAGDPAAPVRRFRSRLVKEGSAGTRREYVEVLTAIDAGPLLLAWLYAPADEATTSKRPLVGTLVAGPGTVGTEPLRPLEPTESAVLRLFGSRANDVRTFANTQHLDYTRPADIAKMMDHYNRIAVVK
ncbi:hypothetical protein [Hymenobacter properus]|uniref:Uncharacterized protein n=1 Tax=Hymenobacter properus TaxID=2791026 RepID=A0A931BCY4_9BACT|nr:hypothetical protein [Hymenobacter properus]MBF9141560.1 hypothetical protein [Hymenobacter properus]MBR7720369.1 hypothetical protein [Microvirga sp. SRT04]